MKDPIADNFVFFWNGMFSNWHPSMFVVNGIKYNTGEQYMMHQKALLFCDTLTAKKIMQSTDPKEQKGLGRQIKGFDSYRWDKVKYDIVKKGLKEKFIQNPVFKKVLLEGKGKTFIEASPYDRVWGIGFKEQDALDNISNWGENLLGKILTELSNEL